MQSDHHTARADRRAKIKHALRQQIGVTDERMTAETDDSVRARSLHPRTSGDHIDVAKQHIASALVFWTAGAPTTPAVDALLNAAAGLLDDALALLERPDDGRH